MDKAAVRKALFTPCRSKEEMDRWIRVFLNIRFPDRIVSDESTSSPLEMIWQLYDHAVRNDTEGWKRIMAYANRFGGKTLGAAVLETMIVLHTERNIAHMAAIKDQSKKAQEYVKGFFSRPHFMDFVEGDNSSEVVVVAYIHKRDGVVLTHAEWEDLPPSEQLWFKRKENYIRIIACTMQSANGQHVEFFVVDEVDVIEKKNLRAYDQAKGGVPTSRGGMEAMTLFTSTRKSRVGKVQEEIDRAPKTGLLLLHWNIIDITEPCPPSRHKPDEPKQTYFINDADVKHITEAEYDALPDSDKTKWYSAEGYAGCKKCPLFAACKGRLATEQHGKVGSFEDGGTALLMPISEVIDKFRDATPEFITTEYLCRKPDTSGLVYPRLNANIHKRTANQIARMVDPDSKVETKAELIRFLAEKGARFATGMDFGYSHLFAVVTFAIWGNLAFVVDAIGLPQQELDDKLTLTEHLKLWNSTIYADPEDPGSIKTFSRKGYKMKDWSKNSGSVKAGIDIVRTKLYSRALGATLYFLADDDDIALLFKHVQDYHYTTGPDGKFTEIPDDTNDDYPDALRYGVMNVFGKDGGLRNVHTVATSVPKVNLEHWTEKVERYNRNVMGDIVRGLTGQPSLTTEAEKANENPNRIKKGSFFWDG